MPKRPPVHRPFKLKPLPRNDDRIRGRRLQDIRARWFRHHPLCALCLLQGRYTEATDLDHVIPLHLGGRDDDSNRQSLCSDCHKEKTLKEKKARAAHRRGEI